MAVPSPNLRLCADARLLGGAGGTGVARYTRALVDAQTALAPDALVLTDDGLFGESQSWQQRAGRWARALVPLPRRAHLQDRDGRQMLHAPDLFRLAQVYFDVHRRLLPVRAPGRGVMHWSYPVPLRLVGWHNVYTVHDVIPLVRPDLSPVDPKRLRRLLHAIARSGDALVTVSAAARDGILATLGDVAGRVVDCGQAIDATPPDLSALPEGMEQGGYFLVCGAIEPRKNLVRLLEAYRRSGAALPLLFVGPDGWRAEEALSAIAATPGARRLGYVADAPLRALLAGGRALLMPSLAEGFGLPVAEAMALGTPVMTSNDGALAEVGGTAVLAVDPADVDAMGLAIRRLAGDDALCVGLARAGRERATRFAPERFAARLGEVYAAVIADDDRPAYRAQMQRGTGD
jgi:glycosyltransferase involved in cell wall biosynthesis